jgi:mannosyltransferase
VILGLWSLGGPAPWLDERVSIQALRDGLDQHLWEAPLLPYYGVLWLWSGGGQWVDVEWLRLLSVLAAAAAVALTSLAASSVAGPKAALAAGLLLALAPGFSRYAAEARPYALAAAAVALATYALVRAGAQPGTRDLVVYASSLTAATVVMPVSLAVVPAHLALISTFDSPSRAFRSWAWALLALVPVVIVELFVGLRFQNLHDWLVVPDAISLLRAPVMIANDHQLGVGGALLPALMVGFSMLSRVGRRVLLGLLLAVVVVWLVSVTVTSFWIPRTFTPLSGVLAMAAGIAFARAGWPWIAGIFGLVLAASAPTHVNVREPDSRGTDARAIARILDAHGQRDDVVVRSDSDDLTWWAVRYLLDEDPRFIEMSSPPPDGRYWVLEPTVDCGDRREWQLAEDAILRLCL